MATIINNPTDTRPISTSDDSPVGIVVGLLVALVLIVLFVMYVLPSLRPAATAPADTLDANINLTVPSVDSGTGGSSGGGTTNP